MIEPMGTRGVIGTVIKKRGTDFEGGRNDYMLLTFNIRKSFIPHCTSKRILIYSSIICLIPLGCSTGMTIISKWSLATAVYHLCQPFDDDEDRVMTVAFPIRRYGQSCHESYRQVFSAMSRYRQRLEVTVVRTACV